MKKLIYLTMAAIAISFCTPSFIWAQGVGINSFGNPPDNSAMLDVSSVNKGLLMPRMTITERNAISTPANGLMIWNTTTNCLEVFVGTWQSLSCVCAGPPSTPGSVSGNSAPCANSTGNVYSISAVSGASSYTWTVPSGATITANAGTSITVTFGALSGTIGVTAVNNCGASGQSTLPITLGGSSGSQTFTFQGSPETFTVPPCVTSVTIDAYGAQGGEPSTGYGGKGGQAKGILPVTPGQILNVFVGGGNCGAYCAGYNGGGSGLSSGGGASDVRVGGTALSNRVIVAGGGGGSGYYNGSFAYGGGAGGGTTGGSGTNVNSAVAGSGGTQSSGGNGGTGQYNGGNGTLGVGGNGGADANSTNGVNAGGGGGGYYGGGGGGYSPVGDSRAAGGGGSNYLGGVTPLLNNSAVQSGNGQVIITW